MALEPPRQDSPDLVLHMRLRRNPKHIIQLLQRALFRLRQPKENHAESNDVHRSVKAESARHAEGAQLARESDGDDGGPEIVGGDGPGHADLAVGQREDFRGVGEGDGAFARRVEGVVDVDEEGYEAEMGARG